MCMVYGVWWCMVDIIHILFVGQGSTSAKAYTTIDNHIDKHLKNSILTMKCSSKFMKLLSNIKTEINDI